MPPLIRHLLVILAPTFVVCGMAAPLVWLWPAIEAGGWYSFPLLLLWFYGTIHLATVALLAVQDA